MNRKRLWYRKPAAKWVEALPVGNGRLGGMVFGQVQDDKIQLNEDSVWYGGPKANAVNPDGLANLPEIRRLLFDGEVEKAAALARMSMFSTPKYYNPYQPLGELKLFFTGQTGTVEGYERELDLSTGIVSIRYRIGDTTYRREVFSSYPDQVLVVRLTCEGSGRLSFGANLNRRPYEGESRKVSDDAVAMRGDCGKDGVEYACVLKGAADGQLRVLGDFVSVEGASEVTLLLAAATTFREKDPEAASLKAVTSASKLSYEELKRRHIDDYFSLYGRVNLKLGGADQAVPAAELPTDERLELCRSGDPDAGLLELFFQYGRYLMIAGSRPGSLPTTLQGIWNDSFTPPWESKYTININTQMNYWPAEVCGLQECHEPLFELVERMRADGRNTARQLYGCNGFVAHHNTNLWAETRPEGIFPTCVIWPMGAAWLSLHLWEHYAYSGDLAFLRERAYPVLKEAAEFFVDYLVETPDGRLVTGPSVSPENVFILPDGEKGALCMGPSMDTQILRELFDACIDSCKLLEADTEFADRLSSLLQRLPKPQIGSRGQLLEWLEEYEEADAGHRHISHLFALHPGTQIDKQRTPELAKAAEETLRHRLANGGGHTGWSSAWIVNMFARLGEGEDAHQHLVNMLRKSTYPNLFDAHPPFQIDGNFGAAAGMAEMLLQSHAGELLLLPALPAEWPEGEVTGLRARGGYRVTLRWSDGALQEGAIEPLKQGMCRVRTATPVVIWSGDAEVARSRAGEEIVEFTAEPDRTYRIVAV
ncbi:glycoside hydrolase family 95 protein [Paenibacillus sp. GD4]|uniref:glycoside hydrolase family 95 protein n=1 Tax=Paenibacillus sp. GD4 TaxID=3068890 RepID=UPI002796CD26|nr:glycoside hydrolase family 95 protein [Paenibacillus sp. GD4]MDQ1912591.1 glycoside hydrolase family 95 protein [Paenibacillus sp. GD4]